MQYVLHGRDHTHATLVSMDDVCEDLLTAGYDGLLKVYQEGGDLSDWCGDLPNTSSNRDEMLRSFAKEHLITAVQKELDQIQEGFATALISPCLGLFSRPGLKLLMCGNAEFGMDDLIDKVRLGNETTTSNGKPIFVQP